MNILKIFCCRQKQKPPQAKPFISAIKQAKRDRKISFRQPSSEPFDIADRYKGQKLNGLPNGNGQMMYKNGDYYRGQWVNGKKEGRGLQIFYEKNLKYQGEWKADLQNGQGKIIYPNQSTYVGEFKDGQAHGKGEFYDVQTKQNYQVLYQNGQQIQRKLKQGVQGSRDEQFPTLVLDKQRFNSQDLEIFQAQNPEIKSLQINFLMKYYLIGKVIRLQFIRKPAKEWKFDQVLQFLKAIGLQKYHQCFHKEKISGSLLLNLKEDEMRDDLKMKLGDRKRLYNYCRFLKDIYDDQNKKDRKKSTTNKKFIGRTHPEKKNRLNFMTAKIDQQDSVHERSEQESDKQGSGSFSNSIKSKSSSKNKNNKNNREAKRNAEKDNRQGDQWSQFYSNNIAFTSLNEPARNSIIKEQQVQAPKSEQSSSTSSINSLSGSGVKNLSIRKKSSQNADEQLISKNLPLKLKPLLAIEADHEGDHEDNKQKEGKFQKNMSHFVPNQMNIVNNNKSSSSKEENSSIQSLDVELYRKRTTGNKNREGGMEIRELYEFLRQRGNLEFIIKQRDIELLDLIGEGGYGKVYKGKYMSCPVAVKDYIKTGRQQNQEDFLKQLQILSDLKHPNIVLYMGICITTDKYQLVTEYLENGSLFDQIHRKGKKFTREELLWIIDDIVKGMVYLHSMKCILHRDLKSSNVLLDEDWKVKLCDFGLSGHKKKTKKKSKGRIGTYQWMAPEVMKKEEMDYFSDVYSFGVIIWELLTNRIPYEGYTEQQIIGQVGYDDNYKLRLDPMDSCWQQDDIIVQIMNDCLNRNPSERPRFREIQTKLNKYLDQLQQAEINIPNS